MYRLRVLYEACTSLLDILRQLIDWNSGNIKIIRKHTKKLTLLPYANTMIEATAAIGEIFKLESIDLSSVKAEHRKYVRKPRADDYKRSGSQAEKLKIKSAEEYTPTLETQINHYRSATYLIGNSLISIIKIMTRVMTRDIMHIESSEVVRILHRLPPMYLRVDPFELSSYNDTILSKPPPNARQFPLAPRGKSDKTVKSGKSTKNANHTKNSQKSGGSKRSSMNASAKGAAKAAAFIKSKLSKNSRGSTNPKTTQGSPKKGSEVGGGKAEQKQAGGKGKKAKKNATKKK
ncbi:hypothetical protein WR25_14475 [Diploscapter pachys]|uniref:Uncharacterized protein n=1 Tax=Diploscapter pachys TaxID=2018661 RepID=A0A2A2KMF8_9BILA|nr:hypothetical protein WR25_14475 [Diploscapter pachys]